MMTIAEPKRKRNLEKPVMARGKWQRLLQYYGKELCRLNNHHFSRVGFAADHPIVSTQCLSQGGDCRMIGDRELILRRFDCASE